MKAHLLASLLSLASVAAYGSALPYGTPFLSCHGELSGNAVRLDVFRSGAPNQALFALQRDGETQVIAATGGSFSECGTRTQPCHWVTSTQYSSETPALILTALYSLGATATQATLDSFPEGFEGPSDKGSVACTVNP
jgi:hypothetical protein